MKRTTFYISDMDCPSEESLIRMRLEGVQGIIRLEFDLGRRQLDVFHQASLEELAEALHSLNLGARPIAESEENALPSEPQVEDTNRGPLMWALAMNAALFVGELTVGLLSGSMGLMADSLDMLADASVYALSLAAIGGGVGRKRRLAAASGYLQVALAFAGLGEVVRRLAAPSHSPDLWPVIATSLVALAANVATLRVLRRAKRGEAHIEASWIFTSNDIKANVLVILGALLARWTSSQLPDLLVGALIFLIVAAGARRILALARVSKEA